MGIQESIELQRLTAAYHASMNKRVIEPEAYPRYGVKRGLRNEDGTGVLVGLTEVGEVFSYYIDDGERVSAPGKLYYRGISLTDIVQNFWSEGRFGFEEVAYLLLYGELPDRAILADFKCEIGRLRSLPENFVEDTILKNPSRDVMNKLARSVLSLYTLDDQADDTDPNNVLKQSLSLIAKLPVLISYAYMAKRHYIDKESLFIHDTPEQLGTAETILRLIRPSGEFSFEEARVLDLAMAVQAEHGGGNNSTFTCRCVTSTGTDTYSAIAAAIGSLKGPRHGGASSKTYHMMQDIKRAVKNWRDERELEAYLGKILDAEAYDRSGLLYGIGHAVYTLSDPRTQLLRDYARSLAYASGKAAEYELYLLVERLGPELVFARTKGKKTACANVDFYTGFLYEILGIPNDLFTAIFAAARAPGWLAHRIEELTSGGRIIRPAYKNMQGRRPYIPMAER